jgi:hypothetical protein
MNGPNHRPHHSLTPSAFARKPPRDTQDSVDAPLHFLSESFTEQKTFQFLYQPQSFDNSPQEVPSVLKPTSPRVVESFVTEEDYQPMYLAELQAKEALRTENEYLLSQVIKLQKENITMVIKYEQVIAKLQFALKITMEHGKRLPPPRRNPQLQNQTLSGHKRRPQEPQLPMVVSEMGNKPGDFGKAGGMNQTSPPVLHYTSAFPANRIPLANYTNRVIPTIPQCASPSTTTSKIRESTTNPSEIHTERLYIQEKVRTDSLSPHKYVSKSVSPKIRRVIINGCVLYERKESEVF